MIVAEIVVLVGVGVSVTVGATVSAGVGDGEGVADTAVEGLLELGPGVAGLPWP